jgi:hypothetical protein
MQKRELTYASFADVHAELDRLLQVGYQQAGTWELAQICDHLSFFIQGSLNGHQFRVPWIIKILFGRLVLRGILKQRRMKDGSMTPQNPLPAPGGDAAAAVARLKQQIDRLQAHQGELHASPFFGYLTPAQWRELHLIHCAHHLAYLVPKTAN